MKKNKNKKLQKTNEKHSLYKTILKKNTKQKNEGQNCFNYKLITKFTQ